MSRIGLKPVKIIEGVEIKVEGNQVLFKGALGENKVVLPKKLKAVIKKEMVDGEEVDCCVIGRDDDQKQTKSVHGTMRSIINNAMNGVKFGYERKLEIVGVGYRGRIEGNQLALSIGYTVPIKIAIPEYLKVTMPDELTIEIKGVDKQLVNQYAAKVRSLKKPEPYKGKGIKYSDEVVRRKSAKSAAA